MGTLLACEVGDNPVGAMATLVYFGAVVASPVLLRLAVFMDDNCEAEYMKYCITSSSI
jgi:hypothetical protein